MISRPIILLSGNNIATNQPLPGNSVDLGYAEEVTFIIDVQAINGAPTTASLKAKFQFCLPHVEGEQFVKERWFDLETVQVDNLIVDGADFPNPLADKTTTLPKTIQRTIKGFGYRTRVLLEPSFTGGTSPSFKITSVMIPKGS